MQIQPVNFNHTTFNGAVQVKNLTNGVTKDYKISHELDKKLITAYKNNLAADPFTNGMQVFEKDSYVCSCGNLVLKHQFSGFCS